MLLNGSRQDKEPGRDYRKIGLLTGVPAIMLAATLVGLFVGQWADRKFGTEPYLTVVGVLLGLISAGIEIVNLLKKASETEKEKDVD